MSKPRIVVFEETGEERIVKGDCLRCFPERRRRHDQEFVVSPNGIAHAGKVNGDTECGIDATRDAWWWPT